VVAELQSLGDNIPEDAEAPAQPRHIFWFVVFGIAAGLVVGLIVGLWTWQVLGFSESFLNSLHPQITGSTGFFLGIFFYNILIFPLLLAAVFGIGLPVAYALRKNTSRRPFNISLAMSATLGIESAVLLLLFWGGPPAIALWAIHLVPLLIASAPLCYIMLRQFNEELRILAELPNNTAADTAGFQSTRDD
jgi:hypothetical protein